MQITRVPFDVEYWKVLLCQLAAFYCYNFMPAVVYLAVGSIRPGNSAPTFSEYKELTRGAQSPTNELDDDTYAQYLLFIDKLRMDFSKMVE